MVRRSPKVDVVGGGGAMSSELVEAHEMGRGGQGGRNQLLGAGSGARDTGEEEGRAGGIEGGRREEDEAAGPSEEKTKTEG